MVPPGLYSHFVLSSENVETIKIVKSLYSEGKKVPDNILRVARNKGLEYVFNMSQESEKKPEKTNVSSNASVAV